MRLAIPAALLVIAIGGVGYLVGGFLQAPDEFLLAIGGRAPSALTAPILLSPASGSEFVDSNITLVWSWSPGLRDNQFFALRVWAEDRPPHEIWTADSRLPAAAIIDSFSLDFGKFYWQVGVLNLSAEGRYESLGSEFSEISQLQRLRRARLPAKSYDEMSPAARHFHDLELSASQLIDAVHLFNAY